MKIVDSNIMQLLRAKEVDQLELSMLIFNHYNHATYDSSQQVSIPNAQDPALVMCYTKSGELQKITVGKAVKAADIEAIQGQVEKLLQQPTRRVARGFLFGQRVDGYFRVIDQLVICPAPTDAPRPNKDFSTHYPFVIERPVLTCGIQSIDYERAYRVIRETGLLLGLAMRPVSIPSRRVALQWMMTDKGEYEYLQTGYHLPNVSILADSFTRQGQLNELKVVPAQQFYSPDSHFAYNEQLTIPGIIERLLTRFEKLSLKKRAQFLRAAYWMHHAVHFARSDSVAYTGYIQAIEALVDGDSTTEKFRAKMQELLADESEHFRKSLEKFYDLRSGILHGSVLFETDERGFGGGWQDPRRVLHSAEASDVQRLVRIAIINWLLRQ